MKYCIIEIGFKRYIIEYMGLQEYETVRFMRETNKEKNRKEVIYETGIIKEI